MLANSAICAIHIYHCLAFRLSAADIFHHLLFVSILCGLGIWFKQVGGVANNFGIRHLGLFWTAVIGGSRAM